VGINRLSPICQPLGRGHQPAVVGFQPLGSGQQAAVVDLPAVRKWTTTGCRRFTICSEVGINRLSSVSSRSEVGIKQLSSVFRRWQVGINHTNRAHSMFTIERALVYVWVWFAEVAYSMAVVLPFTR